MSKQVKVQVTKTYYKSTVIEIDVPEHLTDDEVHAFAESMENRHSTLSDALADASLNGDMDGVEIEIL